MASGIAVLIVVVGVGVLIVAALVGVLRWALKINRIAELLEEHSELMREIRNDLERPK